MINSNTTPWLAEDEPVGFMSLREFRPVLRYMPSDLRVVVEDGGKAFVLRGFLENHVKESSQKGRATTAVL